MANNLKVGIFDSGYGGLTVFRSIMQRAEGLDYVYLGDNARAPYGDHSFQTVYDYTWQCVEWLFNQGCQLVVLACNTASAKALRTIQQNDLIKKYPDRRVLGVIRPTAEMIGEFTRSGKVGVMGTRGTINSESYLMEIANFYPEIQVYQQSCPMWVPLIENNEHLGPGADHFVKMYLDALQIHQRGIDTILLACTHYPLMVNKIREFLPSGVEIVTQGEIVAERFVDYLERHPEIEHKLSKNGSAEFYTTGDPNQFDAHASQFFDKEISSEQVVVV